jgi:hypothetical protein
MASPATRSSCGTASANSVGSVSASAGVISAQGISVGVFDTRNPDKFNLTPWMGINSTAVV